MSDLVLGLDIGTSAAKAILLDLAGHEVAMASQSYPLLTPQPGWVEQDPEAVWQALATVLREIAGKAGEHRITSLALTAQAGWGAGAFPTLEAAIARRQPHVARVRPNPALGGRYAGQLAAYQRVSRAVSEARAAPSGQ